MKYTCHCYKIFYFNKSFTFVSSNNVNFKFYSEADNRNFQSVKHGVRSKGETQKELQLDLENKFSALHQEK